MTGGRHNISNNEVAYRHDISGIVAGYSHSSLKMDKNDGTINSYILRVYTTRQHKTGIRVAVNYEFLKNGDINLNKQTKQANDMSGPTGKYGTVRMPD
ncbi:autotransporter domain-containing protein [Morganella morganii]|nr:hypothetical protein [Morganella morganii]